MFLGEIDKKDREGSPITPIPLGRQKGGNRFFCGCRLSFFYTLNLGLFFLNCFIKSTRAATPSWGMEL